MADTPWDAKQALEERGAGDGPGGDASTALRAQSAAVAAAIGVNITLDFIKWRKANEESPQCQLIGNCQQTGRADAAASERSSRTIPQCRLVEGTAEERDALHNKTIFLQSREPFDYEYSKPGYTFTGISCLPVSADIQSPDAEVISGGVNCSSVTIRLTPILGGHSACRVLVCGKPCTTGPSADVSKQIVCADASASERSSRTILQCRRLVEGTTEERDALQDMTFARRSREPYDYEYSKPGYTFTGISCLPVSAEIPSPDAEVISGGINCSFVTIRLTPVEEGEWACRVLVCGKPCTTGPSAEVSKQTGRTDSSAPASSASPAGAGYVVQ